MKRSFIAVLSVAVLVLVLPLVAYAHGKMPVTCTLTLAVMDPGVATVHGNEVFTSGETTLGALDCDQDNLDGAFTTVHNSRVKLDPVSGSFDGGLKGSFALATASGVLTGRVKSELSGVVVGLAPSPPFPPGTPVHQVSNAGDWKLDSGEVKGRGTFSVVMVGVVGLPASSGGLASPAPGTLVGELK